MIFTHTGLLGDFIQTWPIASWYYQNTGQKIDFVVTDADCFKDIAELTLKQPFANSIRKVPFKVTDYGCGGQPYKFNPADFGINGEYINVGYPCYPQIEHGWIPYLIASEHNFGVDENFVINIPVKEAVNTDVLVSKPFIIEQNQKLQYDGLGKREWGVFMLSYFVPSSVKTISGKNGLYADLCQIKQASHTYVSEGGLSIILDLMDINFTMYYREQGGCDGRWFESVYYRQNNPKRKFISIPKGVTFHKSP